MKEMCKKKKQYKIVACLLLLVLCFSLTSCGTENAGTEKKQEGADTTGFRVGFGRADITATESVPLQGFGNSLTRMSTGFLDYLYVDCVAITDEADETVLLMAYDMCTLADERATELQAAVMEATGVPEDHIMVSASHTHSAPDLNSSDPSINRYMGQLKERSAKAALDALADRRQAEIEIATVNTEGLNFVRRYFAEDGTFVGSGTSVYYKSSAPITRHETQADGALQLMRFTRDGAKDILLSNWQTHPHREANNKNYNMTSDILGPYRDTVEKSLDCHVAYWSGASGNINPYTLVEAEKKADSYPADYREQGRMLANYAIGAEGTYKKVKSGRIGLKKVMYAATVNHSEDAAVNEAKKVQSVWSSTNDQVKALAASDYPFTSPYHANAVVTRSKLAETMELKLTAVSVGDVAFVAAPYEMFDTNGMEIKEGSPYAMTFVLSLSNGNVGYIPSALGFANGGYEPGNSRFVAGTGETLANQFVTMLKELHEK